LRNDVHRKYFRKTTVPAALRTTIAVRAYSSARLLRVVASWVAVDRG
jgi:hypothetical protein